jgi:hypothetical protein
MTTNSGVLIIFPMLDMLQREQRKTERIEEGEDDELTILFLLLINLAGVQKRTRYVSSSCEESSMEVLKMSKESGGDCQVWNSWKNRQDLSLEILVFWFRSLIPGPGLI